jgi:competence/damage-inducible protein CinA-like protein
MRAELLSIGTELLLGHIVDTNSAYLAGRLADLGIDLYWMSTVGDNLGRATDVVRRALDRSDLVVCTGGLGPTEDDLTREAIAAAIGETPQVDPDLDRELREWFARRGVAMPDRNRKQAWLVPGARALVNPLGTAPGWLLEKDGRRLVAMPGVPREMIRMWEHEVEPLLRQAAPIRSRTLKLLGIGESAVEEALGQLVRSTSPTVATYAKADGVHVRVTDRDADIAARDSRIDAMEREIRSRLGGYVWGADADTLGTAIGQRLVACGWRLWTGESITGGELARVLSEADTQGAWYGGGAVLVAAGEAELRGEAARAQGDVVALTGGDAHQGWVIVRTPDKEERAEVRYSSGAEARRRITLAALDLIRRTL